MYKQTVLGPLWQVLQPLLTALVFAVVFGMLGRMTPQGQPALLFYLAGVVPWMFFANVINRTSQTLIWNAALMTKVYFPRIIAPLATTVSTSVSFLVQLALFFVLAVGFRLSGTYSWSVGLHIVLLPLLILLLALLAFGIGILVASLTTRFRDLNFLVGFSVQLLMFVSPVIFPLALVPEGLLRSVLLLNPMTGVVEGFRAVLLGTALDASLLWYPAAFSVVMVALGGFVFQRVQRSFADVI